MLVNKGAGMEEVSSEGRFGLMDCLPVGQAEVHVKDEANLEEKVLCKKVRVCSDNS